eukprot:12905348-Prorocentrum_lima.AAC.1
MEAALKDIDIVHDQSVPGHPKNNSWMERSNRIVLEGARAAILEVGLPLAFSRTLCCTSAWPTTSGNGTGGRTC